MARWYAAGAAPAFMDDYTISTMCLWYNNHTAFPKSKILTLGRTFYHATCRSRFLWPIIPWCALHDHGIIDATQWFCHLLRWAVSTRSSGCRLYDGPFSLWWGLSVRAVETLRKWSVFLRNPIENRPNFTNDHPIIVRFFAEIGWILDSSTADHSKFILILKKP